VGGKHAEVAFVLHPLISLLTLRGRILHLGTRQKGREWG
jgi:hypothetical protein